MEQNNNINQNTATNFQDEESIFKPIDIYYVIKGNWHWFIISISICIGIAFYYIKKSPRIYSRTASILIKDKTNNVSSIDETFVFKDINMFQSKRDLDNEILILQSKQLMEETVRRLKLDISYSIDKGFRMSELYTQSPIIISFPDASETQTFSLEATILPSKQVSLSNFSENQEKKITVNFNDTVQTPVGKVVIAPTFFYTDKYFEKSIHISKGNLKAVAQYYRSALQVTIANETTSMVYLTLLDVSALRAEDVINTLIAVYNEETINIKNQIAINTSNFINERLIIIERELGTVDSNIASYKSENKVTDINSEIRLYLQDNRQYNKEGIELENQLNLVKYLHQYLTNPKNNSALIPANTGAEGGIEARITAYNTLLLQREKLIMNSSDNNPVVMDMNNSLQVMKQNIIQTVDNHIMSIRLKIKNNRAQEAQTSRLIEVMPEQQKDILSVERQQKIKEGLYLYLLNQREKSILSQAITESDARVIDSASGASYPIFPKKKKIITTALLIGFAIPACILWLMNILNTRVRNRKDIESATTIPFLGEIPLREKTDKREIVVHENKQDFISESFRIIRTNMDFMQTKENKKQVIMFTSFNVSAGKTFVSSNLAMSFTFTNKKVILVDLDIRKGSLSKRTGLHNKTGITNYLSEMVDSVDDIIMKNGFENKLDVILAGAVPPNPTELLLSSRLELLIEELKKRYDYIFLDNVPSGIIADATIVNRVADLTIYLIRVSKMDRRQLPELERLYKSNKFNNMCIILNGAQKKYQGNGYYGYGYGYNYGYENKSESK